MTEYSDKNTAITAVGEAIADGASWFDALERILPADVQPVVRCQNCQYSREPDRHNVAENAACDDMLICFVDEQVYPPSRNDVFVGREFFCGFGEARNG